VPQLIEDASHEIFLDGIISIEKGLQLFEPMIVHERRSEGVETSLQPIWSIGCLGYALFAMEVIDVQRNTNLKIVNSL